MKPIIIIGAGLAAYTVAREVRKLDKTVTLTIITADKGGFYSKPMLSNAFAQKREAAQLISQSAAQMAEQLDAELITSTRVDSIDGTRKVILTNSGEYEYEKLVIASGAQAIRLDVGGDAADQILSVNHIDDYEAFRTRLASISSASPVRVAILGAGLIGCEFANDLTGAGYAVSLVDPNPLPLAALAAPTLSAALHSALSAAGVSFHLGTTALSVDHAGNSLRLNLANGSSFETDIVLSAVGLRPDLRLAHAAQLKAERGIVVDGMGQTSMPDIYAVGDCAEYRIDDKSSSVLPYVAPLMTAARAIARTVIGQPTPIDLKPAPVLVKTPSLPIALIPPPRDALSGGQWLTEQQDERMICRFFDKDGVMQGFGVAPHDAASRQALLSQLGTSSSAA